MERTDRHGNRLMFDCRLAHGMKAARDVRATVSAMRGFFLADPEELSSFMSHLARIIFSSAVVVPCYRIVRWGASFLARTVHLSATEGSFYFFAFSAKASFSFSCAALNSPN
jgi:hypothetical protein